MPVNLERCVKKVMKEQSISESKAFAICNASINAADAGLLLDAANSFKAKISDTTGFLTAPVILARTGVQYYYGFELGLEDRALEKIGVFRSAEEVFHPESINSFINLTVTDDHPSELVGLDNVKELQVGTVSEVKREGDFLVGIATITDSNLIAKVGKGKVQDSVGYTNDLEPSVGKFNGDKYEFVQTKIHANHLAIVDAGRCGPACKLTMDHKTKEKTMIKVTLDGISFDVEDDQLGQAILKQQKAHDAENEEMKKKFEKKAEEDEEEKEQLKKEKDKAEATKDAALKNVLDDKAIDALVTQRAELLSTAKRILGDKMPECTDCEKELKTAVIDKVLDLGIKDWSSKEMSYVNPSYDIAVIQEAKAKKSLDNLTDDFLTDKEGNAITRESARAKYMKDELKLEEEV